jgi:lipid-binding SYLF domain-containing protein
MKSTYTRILAAVLPLTFIAGGCSTAPKTQAKRQSLLTQSTEALDDFKQTDPTVDRFLKNAYGYAVFPGIGKGAIGVGGAYGRGVVYEQGKFVGFCDMSQGSIGFQLGGQEYSELIAFQNRDALDNFKGNNMEFAAQASAVAATAGAAATAKYDHGVKVFTETVGGLMYEASVGGQKFEFVAAASPAPKAATDAMAETDMDD